MALDSIEDLIKDMREGRMVILMDDEDRENEGDLIMAAEKVTADDINFMAQYGRGLICLTLTRDRCEQLRLPLMVDDNQTPHSTNFTVSIEAAEGVTTGISAADRAVTVQAAVAGDATPRSIVQPGHIFPLMAQPGGVLTRAGHTEAGCDLARLAGVEPAAVIVEILNEDGTMARRPDLEKFAAHHNIKIGTIADLIEHRVQNEKTVEAIGRCALPTEYGDFDLTVFEDSIEGRVHLALTMGDIQPDDPTLVRVHMYNSVCDLFGAKRGGCHWPLQSAMERIAREGKGVLVVLRQKETSRDIAEQVRQYELEDKGVEAQEKETWTDLRTYGLGAQILSQLGVRKMRVISSPMKVHALSGFDMEIVEYVDFD